MSLRIQPPPVFIDVAKQFRIECNHFLFVSQSGAVILFFFVVRAIQLFPLFLFLVLIVMVNLVQIHALLKSVRFLPLLLLLLLLLAAIHASDQSTFFLFVVLQLLLRAILMVMVVVIVDIKLAEYVLFGALSPHQQSQLRATEMRHVRRMRLHRRRVLYSRHLHVLAFELGPILFAISIDVLLEFECNHIRLPQIVQSARLGGEQNIGAIKQELDHADKPQQP
mmetsp:Transcript_8598/g.14140  ORF Transcript_8598/g.14140 Transcript_8598/m.14140 type:complete len:223 (-) Transcript_8598:1049-1717(-)